MHKMSNIMKNTIINNDDDKISDISFTQFTLHNIADVSLSQCSCLSNAVEDSEESSHESTHIREKECFSDQYNVTTSIDIDEHAAEVVTAENNQDVLMLSKHY